MTSHEGSSPRYDGPAPRHALDPAPAATPTAGTGPGASRGAACTGGSRVGRPPAQAAYSARTSSPSVGGRPLHLSVRRAAEPDVRRAAEVIAAAFASLHASTWLVPDSAQREQVLARVFTINVAHALDYGVVDLLTARPLHPSTTKAVPGTGELPATEAHPPPILGVAVWLDHTRPVPAPPNYEDRLYAAAGGHTPAFAHLDQLFAQHHPGESHHQLALFAVPPDHHDRGFGAVLLTHGLARLDASAGGGGIPAYLEAAGTRSQPLYTRHGFQPNAPLFRLPNGASFQPMWRHATEGGGDHVDL